VTSSFCPIKAFGKRMVAATVLAGVLGGCPAGLAGVAQASAPPLPQYPRSQMTRPEWMTLNGSWQFQPATPNLSPPVGRTLRAGILVPYPPESSLSGVGRHYNHMWYRRLFTVPAQWHVAGHCSDASCRRLLLHFGAVDYASTVYVNGHLVAAHQGGYDSFTVDISGALRARGQQELVVGVSDLVEKNPFDQVVGKQRLSNAGPIWYQPSSGIWQTVWLEPVPADHIDQLQLTPDPATDTLQVSASTSGGAGESITAVAYDGATAVGSVSGPAGAPLQLSVPDPKLWTPASPFLYRLTVALTVGGQLVDQVGSYFGMRSIAVGMFDGQPHILLNGKFVFQLGMLDQGYWPGGLYTAPTDTALRSDLVQDKAIGFNTVREHMKVEPDRWYYWADRVGMLVWQDMPALARPPTDVAEEQQYESQLHAIVEQLQAHPSIVVWTPFNEGWGEFDPAHVTSLVKAWDPSRLVDTDSGQNCCLSLRDTGSGDIYDNHAYPGPAAFSPFDGRAVVDGEFGGLGLLVHGHSPPRHGWAHEMERTPTQLTSGYVRLLADVRGLEIQCGLSAAIYTQAYDIEDEVDGLETYDRAVLKVNRAQITAVNAAVLSAASRPQPGRCSAAGGGAPV
jgi:beta-galactosidase/beta-glucuronidase